MKIGEILVVDEFIWSFTRISKLDVYFTYEKEVMLWKLKHGRPLTIKSPKIIVVLTIFY